MSLKSDFTPIGEKRGKRSELLSEHHSILLSGCLITYPELSPDVKTLFGHDEGLVGASAAILLARSTTFLRMTRPMQQECTTNYRAQAAQEHGEYPAKPMSWQYRP